ncbi:GIY-YIG nuclease family protein [Halomonas heilongjiangensis]|uniref:GIY-YIG nuclease family protein n=1 Tax=Halomonas heilongjiangensis TaxID=1387883 RepID=UPI0015E8A3A9|nr:GIY-YIG nuclease family protein [Halomonas heilongjiangensis]
MEDALYLDAEQYRKRYGTRKTNVTVDGELISLYDAYLAFPEPIVDYRIFWQRVKRLQRDGLLDISTMEQAASLTTAHWITIFGGGRRRSFKYEGDEFPEHVGRIFSSVTAFLLEINRYDDRHSIWARLKRGWGLDEAVVEPLAPLDDRSGQIYVIICSESKKKYIGLTRMSLQQRWRHHVRVAMEGDAKTPLAKAIRKFGEDNFSMEVIESELNQDELPIREKFWIDKLKTLEPGGLNASPGGQMGGGKGRAVEYEGESFNSLESAAAVLSERTGIARHVVLRRLSRGDSLPESARKMSKHPEAGSNLWRRWKSLINSIRAGRREGVICERWENYDNFSSDVRDGYKPELRLIRKDTFKPWCQDNFEWVSKQTAVEIVHGKTYQIGGGHSVHLLQLQGLMDFAHRRLSIGSMNKGCHLKMP